jgi:DNA-binding MarR family transcriptional regulator
MHMQDSASLARWIPAVCIGHRTRMAARALSRHYHSHFRGTNLTASQFGILVSLAAKPDQSIAQLAGDLGMEPTTMVRAVQQLERRGLVRASGRGRQSKRSNLTPAGWRILQRGVRRWQAAHDAVVDALGGGPAAATMLAALKKLERIAGSLRRAAASNRANGARRRGSAGRTARAGVA